MNDLSLLYHIILRWALVALSLAGVTLMFYYFACAICKKKVTRTCVVLALVVISIAAYVIRHTHPRVVYMREDTLYISPRSE